MRGAARSGYRKYPQERQQCSASFLARPCARNFRYGTLISDDHPGQILDLARARRRGERAGRRRRDAGPLLVRRGRAHLARGAGARGQGCAHGGAPRRRRERGAQRRRAGRAGHAALGDRRRRGGSIPRRAGAPRRHRDLVPHRSRARHHGQAARHRPPAAAAAHRFRARAFARGARNQARGLHGGSPPPTASSCCRTTGRAGSRTSPG